MYEIVIVDNQKDELEELEKMIHNFSKELIITGTGLSGSEALRLAEEKKPDILFMSVRLSEYSGLEVARKVRSKDKEIVIILKSAYDYFDFAREAMELGVAEYLLKPVSQTVLTKALKKILDTLREKEARKIELKKKDQVLSDMTEFAGYSFIYAALFDGGGYASLKRYKDLFGLDDYGYVINLEIRSFEQDSILRAKKDSGVLYAEIKKLIPARIRFIAGPILIKRVIIYINVPGTKTEEVLYEECKKTARLLVRGLKNRLKVNIAAGIGSIRSLERMHDSYEEALRCLRYKQEDEVVHIKDIHINNIQYKDYLMLEAKLMDGVKFGKEESIDYFIQILDYLKPLQETDAKNKILELMVLACRSARQEGQNESEYLDYKEYVRELSLLEGDEIRSWAHKLLEYIIKSVRTSRSARKSDTIKDALQYITDHFSQEISLDEVAQYVGISPQHFSKLFKEETGTNYVEYVTRLRMETAKDYLKDGSKTIKEICYAVGYNDPNYFSRLFKKMIGISPSEFVKIDKNE